MKNCLFGVLLLMLLSSYTCRHEVSVKEVHPLNDLFKNSKDNNLLYDFRKRPNALEQALIEQVPLRACDDFGTCDLNMNFAINDTDTICLPVYLDGLFKTEDTSPFCGYRNVSMLLINQNNQLLYEERPIDLSGLKIRWLNALANAPSDEVFYMNVKWHPFTNIEFREKVFVILMEVITMYYEQASQHKFKKSISKLTSIEKNTLMNEAIQIKYYQRFNQKKSHPVQIHLNETQLKDIYK